MVMKHGDETWWWNILRENEMIPTCWWTVGLGEGILINEIYKHY